MPGPRGTHRRYWTTGVSCSITDSNIFVQQALGELESATNDAVTALDTATQTANSYVTFMNPLITPIVDMINSADACGRYLTDEETCSIAIRQKLNIALGPNYGQPYIINRNDDSLARLRRFYQVFMEGAPTVGYQNLYNFVGKQTGYILVVAFLESMSTPKCSWEYPTPVCSIQNLNKNFIQTYNQLSTSDKALFKVAIFFNNQKKPETGSLQILKSCGFTSKEVGRILTSESFTNGNGIPIEIGVVDNPDFINYVYHFDDQATFIHFLNMVDVPAIDYTKTQADIKAYVNQVIQAKGTGFYENSDEATPEDVMMPNMADALTDMTVCLDLLTKDANDIRNQMTDCRSYLAGVTTKWKSTYESILNYIEGALKYLDYIQKAKQAMDTALSMMSNIEGLILQSTGAGWIKTGILACLVPFAVDIPGVLDSLGINMAQIMLWGAVAQTFINTLFGQLTAVLDAIQIPSCIMMTFINMFIGDVPGLGFLKCLTAIEINLKDLVDWEIPDCLTSLLSMLKAVVSDILSLFNISLGRIMFACSLIMAMFGGFSLRFQNSLGCSSPALASWMALLQGGIG